MFLVSALIVAAAQVPTDYNGVWGDSQGNFFVIYDSRLVTIAGDKIAWTDDLSPVDNGGFYGKWVKAKSPRIGIERPSQNPVFYNLDNPVEGDRGEIRITDGPGKTDITIKMRDGRQISTYNGFATFLGKSPVMNISGTYKEKDLSCTLAETEGRSERFLSGTITLFGHTYSVKGKRRWEKAWFNYTDRDNGSVMGSGFIIWWPTKDYLDNRPLSDGASTDQIRVYLRSTNSDFPGGVNRLLKHQY